MSAEEVTLLPWILGACALIVVNALLVAMELALLRACLSHFEPELAERLEDHEGAKSLVEHAESTARMLRTGSFLSVGAFALILYRIAAILHGRAEVIWGANWALAAGIAAFMLGCGIFLFFGVHTPRVIGLRYSEAVLKMGSHVIFLFKPLDFFAVRPMRVMMVRLLGMTGEKGAPGIESLGFEEQIEHPGEGVRPMPVMARKIFLNALQMRGLTVGDVLLPRHQVQWMDLNDTTEANLKLARETGHTRFPLCTGDLDRCVGLIHIKDIFRKSGGGKALDLRLIKRDILRISPDMSVEDAMHMLLSRRQHMALVVDEFRGAEGVVTLERLLELLVGDIRDEFDNEEDNIKRMPNGEFSVSGLTPVYELERELNKEFTNKEVATFGGQITAELGRIPERGEHLKLDGLEIVVTEVDERRVIRARVHPLPPEEADEGLE
jgi:CBS domain containing-hemolysin-like protein